MVIDLIIHVNTFSEHIVMFGAILIGALSNRK